MAAARAGAAELMSRRDDRVVYTKGLKDLVTDADFASQKAIREHLAGSFPSYAFVGEEKGQTDPPPAVRNADPDAPPCWVVDPLDGTVNYVHGLQSFAVSIGLHAGGRMRLGVVYDPTRDEMYAAIDGDDASQSGAWCNEVPIAPSGETAIAESLIACSFPAGVKSDHPTVEQFIRVLERCRSLRRLGSCALNLCYVASGKLDAYWANSVCSWDAAGGSVIARMAGATITDVDGTSPLDDWDPRFCVAGSEPLHREICASLG